MHILVFLFFLNVYFLMFSKVPKCILRHDLIIHRNSEAKSNCDKGRWDNFPDICENCNLAVLLMMSWREDSLRGIEPKGSACRAKVNGAPWSHGVALRTRTPVTNALRYGSFGLSATAA